MFPVDLNLLRNEPEKFREAFRKRFMEDQIWFVDKALELDEKRRSLQRELDSLKSQLNKTSRIIGAVTNYLQRKSSKEDTIKFLSRIVNDPEKYLSEEKVEKLKKEISNIKNKIDSLDKELKQITYELIDILWKFPNFVDEGVPVGPDDSYNVPIRFWGIPRVWKEHLDTFKEQTEKYGFKIVELKEFFTDSYQKYVKDSEKLKIVYESLKGNEDFQEINFNEVLDFDELNKDKIIPYVLIDWEPKHHYDLVKEFDLADTDKSGEVSGSRFYFEKNSLVFLDLALSLHGLKFYQQLGYNTVIIPPYLMKKDIEARITYYEAFKEAIYHVVEDNLILITTSEHPICAYYMDTTFDERELPIKILAWSPAFRKEAGAHGKDTKGIFRTHQFHKVELHVICKLNEDKKHLKDLVGSFEKFMQSLNIPYRVVLLSSGDMDKRATIQYDLEGWFPGQGKYRELGSLATMTDWVSRKVNIKVRAKEKIEYVANLYATGCAVQRTLCCILENYYDIKNNAIVVPKILGSYINTEKIIIK